MVSSSHEVDLFVTAWMICSGSADCGLGLGICSPFSSNSGGGRDFSKLSSTAFFKPSARRRAHSVRVRRLHGCLGGAENTSAVASPLKQSPEWLMAITKSYPAWIQRISPTSVPSPTFSSFEMCGAVGDEETELQAGLLGFDTSRSSSSSNTALPTRSPYQALRDPPPGSKHNLPERALPASRHFSCGGGTSRRHMQPRQRSSSWRQEW